MDAVLRGAVALKTGFTLKLFTEKVSGLAYGDPLTKIVLPMASEPLAAGSNRGCLNLDRPGLALAGRALGRIFRVLRDRDAALRRPKRIVRPSLAVPSRAPGRCLEHMRSHAGLNAIMAMGDAVTIVVL